LLLSSQLKRTFSFSFNRNWRFNKELRLWLTKEQRSTKALENGLGEVGMFTYWDPDNWEKSRKEFSVLYADLEDKSSPAFSGPTVQPTAAQQQQQIQAVQQAQAQAQSRVFGGLAMTAAAM
jgi:CCR4-NOT transcription complex subunit 2